MISLVEEGVICASSEKEAAASTKSLKHTRASTEGDEPPGKKQRGKNKALLLPLFSLMGLLNHFFLTQGTINPGSAQPEANSTDNTYQHLWSTPSPSLNYSLLSPQCPPCCSTRSLLGEIFCLAFP